jgi:hypothetical protein
MNFMISYKFNTFFMSKFVSQCTRVLPIAFLVCFTSSASMLLSPVLHTVQKAEKAQWYNEWVRVPAGAGNFSIHHRVQTGSGVHPVSYPLGTWSLFHRAKAAEAWSSPLIHLVPRSRMLGAISPLPQYTFMAWCIVKAQGHYIQFKLRSHKSAKSCKLCLEFKVKVKLFLYLTKHHAIKTYWEVG